MGPAVDVLAKGSQEKRAAVSWGCWQQGERERERFRYVSDT